MSSVSPSALRPDMTMDELLEAVPSAQRALFTKYHIGGCNSCGFEAEETLAQVCERNGQLPVADVISYLEEAQQEDLKTLVSPEAAKTWMDSDNPPRVLDVRMREEYEAVHLPRAILFSQELLQEIFTTWGKDTPILICDHAGERAMDATAYFRGHGFTETKTLDGGIDAYAEKVDPSMPRYRLEFEGGCCGGGGCSDEGCGDGGCGDGGCSSAEDDHGHGHQHGHGGCGCSH